MEILTLYIFDSQGLRVEGLGLVLGPSPDPASALIAAGCGEEEMSEEQV